MSIDDIEARLSAPVPGPWHSYDIRALLAEIARLRAPDPAAAENAVALVQARARIAELEAGAAKDRDTIYMLRRQLMEANSRIERLQRIG